MSQKVYSVLVYDNEYLVAMDAERMLTDALGCHVRIAARHHLAELNNPAGFDLAIVDYDGICDPLRSAITARARFVLLSTFDPVILNFGIPNHEAAPIVTKPFDEVSLIGAVSSIMSLKKTPPLVKASADHLATTCAGKPERAGSGP